MTTPDRSTHRLYLDLPTTHAHGTHSGIVVTSSSTSPHAVLEAQLRTSSARGSISSTAPDDPLPDAVEADLEDELRQIVLRDRQTPSLPDVLDAASQHTLHAHSSTHLSEGESHRRTVTPPPSRLSPRTLWLEQPVERGRTPVSTSSHHRSTSVPSKPLKSALAGSPPLATMAAMLGSRKKKVNFSDEGALKRSETAPAVVKWSQSVNAEGRGDSFSSFPLEGGSGGIGEVRRGIGQELQEPVVAAAARAGVRGGGEDSEDDGALHIKTAVDSEDDSEEDGLPGSLPTSPLRSAIGDTSIYTVDPRGNLVYDSAPFDEDVDDPPALVPDDTINDQPDSCETDSSISEDVLRAPQGHEMEVLETYSRMHEIEKRRFSVEEREELKVWSTMATGSTEKDLSDEDQSSKTDVSAADPGVEPTATSDITEANIARLVTEQQKQDMEAKAKRPLYPFSRHVPYERTLSGGKGSWRSLRHISAVGDTVLFGDALEAPPHRQKADPAQCALTALAVCGVKTPSSSSIRELVAAQHMSRQTTQTVCSPDSTFQALWEEPVDEVSVDKEYVLDAGEDFDSLEAVADEEDIFPTISREPSPMSQARTRLAAWSWTREQGLDNDEDPPWIPLMAVNESSRRRSSERTEGPFAPPNTARGSSAFPSTLHTPAPYDAEDEDNETPPVAMRTNPLLTLSAPEPSDYLTFTKPSPHSLPVSPLGTQYPHAHAHALSSHSPNLTLTDTHPRIHRDSVELSRRHLENEAKMNARLMTTNDSFLLTRSRYHGSMPCPYGKSAATVGTTGGGVGGAGGGWNRMGGLCTIIDASPPSERSSRGLGAGLAFAAQAEAEAEEEDRWHPDEHVGCAIYEVERPRWFSSRYGHERGHGSGHQQALESRSRSRVAWH